MDIEELLAREGIRDTMARYMMASDWLEPEAFAACFTEDAVLVPNGRPDPTVQELQGSNQIFQWFSGYAAKQKARSANEPGGPFIRHHVTTSKINMDDANSATGITYWNVYWHKGILPGGFYKDRFSKVNDGRGDRWLIARRELCFDR